MSATNDITGQRFGKWVVIRWIPKCAWLCQCDCGNTGVVTRKSLVSGRSTRCKQCHKKHGMVHTATYSSYSSMITRCTNPKAKTWAYYGGAGVRVCDDWLGEHGFENFLACVGERPVRGTLDRYPNKSGNYEPGNVRWATMAEQSQNRRSTKLTPALVLAIRKEYSEGVISTTKLAQKYGVSRKTIKSAAEGMIWKNIN